MVQGNRSLQCISLRSIAHDHFIIRNLSWVRALAPGNGEPGVDEASSCGVEKSASKVGHAPAHEARCGATASSARSIYIPGPDNPGCRVRTQIERFLAIKLAFPDSISPDPQFRHTNSC